MINCPITLATITYLKNNARRPIGNVQRAIGGNGRVDGGGEACGKITGAYAAGAKAYNFLCARKCTPQGYEDTIVITRELVCQIGGDASGGAVGDELVDGRDDLYISGWAEAGVAIVPRVAMFAAGDDAMELFWWPIIG